MSLKKRVCDSVIRGDALREDWFGVQSSKGLSGDGVHAERGATRSFIDELKR